MAGALEIALPVSEGAFHPQSVSCEQSSDWNASVEQQPRALAAPDSPGFVLEVCAVLWEPFPCLKAALGAAVPEICRCRYHPSKRQQGKVGMSLVSWSFFGAVHQMDLVLMGTPVEPCGVQAAGTVFSQPW